MKRRSKEQETGILNYLLSAMKLRVKKLKKWREQLNQMIEKAESEVNDLEESLAGLQE
jgi:prefoldin subunit 5